MSYDPMNVNTYSYNTPSQRNPWGQQHTYNSYTAQPRLNSTVVVVTSLEEALIRTSECNSDMVYFHQDKNEFYRVKVDSEGRKSWAAFPYSLHNQEDTTPATKADIRDLVTRVEALEAQNKNKKKEVTNNAESNGQSTVFDFSEA